MFSSLLSRIAWNPYYASSPRRHSSTRLKLPAIISSLDSKFELEVNEWCSKVTNDTKEWTEAQIDFTCFRRRGSREQTEDSQESFSLPDMKVALLAAMAFPFADYTQLRVCADCLQWAFLLQWWTFEGSYLYKYEGGGHDPEGQMNGSHSSEIEKGLARLLDSVLARIPKNHIAPVAQSSILYCERLVQQSAKPSEVECEDSRIVVQARKQIEGFILRTQTSTPTIPSSLSWSTPSLALMDFTFDFSSLKDDKYHTDIRRAAEDIIQGTHDLLSFTSALCTSSDPSRRSERYPAWFSSNALLDICKAQQGAPLLAKIGLLPPSHAPIAIEDLQQGVDTLGARIVQRMEDLHALRPDEENEGEKKRYWTAVTSLVAGVLHWSFQSEIYFRPSSIGMHVAMHCLLDVDNFHILSGLTGGDQH